MSLLVIFVDHVKDIICISDLHNVKLEVINNT